MCWASLVAQMEKNLPAAQEIWVQSLGWEDSLEKGMVESQTGIKIARRNISHPIYADDTTLMAESEEELISLLMKVKEESEKAG